MQLLIVSGALIVVKRAITNFTNETVLMENSTYGALLSWNVCACYTFCVIHANCFSLLVSSAKSLYNTS